jgi:hypothetical protein
MIRNWRERLLLLGEKFFREVPGMGEEPISSPGPYKMEVLFKE